MGPCGAQLPWGSRGRWVWRTGGYGIMLLILGGLFPGGGTEARAVPYAGEPAVLSACPRLHRFVARGATAAIPLRLPRGSVALCRVDARRSRCNWVAVLVRGRPYVFRRAFQGRVALHPAGLVVQELTDDVAGEYRVLAGQNRTCLAQILLTAVGPLFFYRFLLLLPGLLIMAVLVLMWDWLIKVRAHPSTAEGQRHRPVISDS